jgi:hypothetical protein
VIRAASLVSLLALVSCAQSGLRGQIADLRAEIQALERDSVTPDSPLWPDQGENAFNKYIEDYTPRIPDFIYNHVFGKLSTMKESELAAAAQPKTVIEDLIDNPTPARGKLWRVTGRIGHLAPQRAVETSTKSKEVFVGTLFVGEQPVHFHVVNKPDVVYLGSDEVEMIGVFVKVLGYPKSGDLNVNAPFFMAKSLRKYY